MDPFTEAPFPHGEAGPMGSQNDPPPGLIFIDVQAGSGIVHLGLDPGPPPPVKSLSVLNKC